jgi:hypothetical protein
MTSKAINDYSVFKALRPEATDYAYTPLSFHERETARGTQLVNMNNRGTVVCQSDEVKRIATFGLHGCTAAAVAIEKTNGERRGYVQHYSFDYEDLSV